jgi:hypothetical protein
MGLCKALTYLVIWVDVDCASLVAGCRCNMVPGYVVPRSQLAFTQPTEEGAKLAAAFTGTPQFMVYGIE